MVDTDIAAPLCHSVLLLVLLQLWLDMSMRALGDRSTEAGRELQRRVDAYKQELSAQGGLNAAEKAVAAAAGLAPAIESEAGHPEQPQEEQQQAQPDVPSAVQPFDPAAGGE